MAFMNDEYDKFDKMMTELEQKHKLEQEQKKIVEDALKKAQKKQK